jgi:hypothetical protein
MCGPAMSSARHFVYRYGDNADTDEVEFDRDGDMPIPKQNSVVLRKGSRWKVESVQVEAPETAASTAPIFRVFLERV